MNGIVEEDEAAAHHQEEEEEDAIRLSSSPRGLSFVAGNYKTTAPSSAHRKGNECS